MVGFRWTRSRAHKERRDVTGFEHIERFRSEFFINYTQLSTESWDQNSEICTIIQDNKTPLSERSLKKKKLSHNKLSILDHRDTHCTNRTLSLSVLLGFHVLSVSPPIHVPPVLVLILRFPNCYCVSIL